MTKGWEVYAPDWGYAEWTRMDEAWKTIDEWTKDRPYTRIMIGRDREAVSSLQQLDAGCDRGTNLGCAIYYNDVAVPIWNSLRFTSQPEDLRLVNCARKIKKAFRRASNDPSYKMCRRRILTLLYT